MANEAADLLTNKLLTSLDFGGTVPSVDRSGNVAAFALLPKQFQEMAAPEAPPIGFDWDTLNPRQKFILKRMLAMGEQERAASRTQAQQPQQPMPVGNIRQ